MRVRVRVRVRARVRVSLQRHDAVEGRGLRGPPHLARRGEHGREG